MNLDNTTNYAPFIDINNDGIYNALNGDYPDVPGEQALWWIYNDGGSHSQSDGPGMNFEFQGLAYACNQDPIKDVTFYKIKMTNKSKMKYHHCKFALFSAADLGDPYDDFVGFDSSTNTSILYNGTSYDNQYGSALTQTGITILDQPKENNLLPNSMSSFMYFFSVAGNYQLPLYTRYFYNSMNSNWKDSTHLHLSCDGYTGTINTNFIFDNDPSLPGLNSEVWCGNTPGDRNFIMSSNEFDFTENTSQIVAYAVLNTPLGSDNSNFKTILKLADQVHLLKDACNTPLQIQQIFANNSIQIYPNPATNLINIKSEIGINKLTILSIDGKIIFQENYLSPVNSKQINTLNFANGNYIIQLSNDKNVWNKKIVVGE